MRGRGGPWRMEDRDDDRHDWEGGPRGMMGPGGPRPMMGMGGRMGGPLQEMFDACAGKKAGDDCSVKRDDWELKSKLIEG